MLAGYHALTEKEKQTLRLIVRGHDAKSMARHLGLSVHTVNERLRDARRKLEVSSSREAGRLLLDTEGEGPQKLADKHIGEAGAPSTAAYCAVPETGQARAPGAASRLAGPITGVAVMSVLVAILALAVSPPVTGEAVSSGASAAPVAEAEVVHAARDWLALHDEGRWAEGWNATSASFRQLNTVERWTEVAQSVRPPLGTMISRTAIGRDFVPAPPAGVEVVKFRTQFANKADVVETVSLAREDGEWKVVGIFID